MRSPSTTVRNPLDASWPDLVKAFQIDDPDDVRAFLASHPTVAKLLLEIREEVPRYFGDDPMALEIFRDPEWEEAEPLLFVVIQTTAPKGLNRLMRFDDEWWLAKGKETAAPVVVSYDYVNRV